VLVLSFLCLSTAWAGDLTHPLVRHSDIVDGRPDSLPEGFVQAYETGAGFTLEVGDTLTLGQPQGASATAMGNATVATAVGRSWYASVYNGTQAATMGKAVLSGLSGAPDPALYMAPASLAGAEVRVVRMKLAGTKRKPTVWAECELVEAKSRANSSGIVTVSDIDLALRTQEVSSGELVTRELAIQRLKEAKDLLDIGVYTQEQFEAEKAKYLPYVAP
jgi:hypothetical protein